LEVIKLLSPLIVTSEPNRAFASEAPQLQPDLLYMKSVLVSTGKNANDDVFLPDEMWKARATPKLKPVDWEHNTGRELLDNALAELKDKKKIVEDNQIIGVMYNSYVADKLGNIISDEVARASDFVMPSDFDIINEAVIFKYLFPKAAARILRDAEQDKLFVSMEAWFGAFDYRVGNKVVARNSDTAFLDKYLRANGGVGVFNGQEVGRVLRNIVFGGVGIVSRPANKDSVIQSFTNAELRESNLDGALVSHVIGTLVHDSNESKVTQEVIEIMEKPTNEAAPVALATVEDYKQVIQQLVKAEQTVEAKNAEVATAKAEVQVLTDKVQALETVIGKGLELVADKLGGDAKAKLLATPATEVFPALAGLVGDKLAVVADVQLKLAEAESKLKAMEAEKVLASRIAKIGESLNLTLAATDSDEMKAKKKAKSEKLAKSVEHLDDVAFAAWLDELKDVLTLAATPPWMKKEEEKPEDEKDKKEKAKSEEITDPAILDNVQAATASITPGVENTAPVSLHDKMKSLASELIVASKRTKNQEGK
jgi:hypothetical protein